MADVLPLRVEKTGWSDLESCTNAGIGCERKPWIQQVVEIISLRRWWQEI